MERRQALRRIGLGGAAAATATTIFSSPAFAYDQPFALTAPTMTVVTSGGQAVVSIIDGTAGCPASANSTSAAVVGRSTTVSGTPPPFFGFTGRWLLGGAPLPQTTTATVFALQRQVFIAFFGGWLNIGPQNGDSFTAAITITYRCTYSDGTIRDLVVTQTRTATLAGGWTVV